MHTPYTLGLESDSVPVLSTEMIQPQLNDYVTPAITECFTNIIDMVNKYSIINSVDAFNKREIASEFTKLDAIITKRFGIPFKHIATSFTAYAVYVVAPKTNSILNKNIEEHYNEVKKMLSGTDTKNTPANLITSYEHEADAVMANWKKGMDDLEKTMNTSGVVVDLKKAYIYNYPESATNFILCDIYNNIINYKLTAEHLTAILLHEIGHAFTMTEYNYRTVNNTSVLLDSIQTMVIKQNKPLKEALLLAYSKAYGTDAAKKLHNKNVVTVLVASVEAALSDFTAFSKSMYNNIDAEQLADQFAGRFGMGAYLVEGLTNLNTVARDMYQMEMIMSMAMSITLGFIYLILISGNVIVAGVGILAVVAFTMLFMGIGIILDAMLSSGGLTSERTYDSDKVRLARIRNELVRQIRNYDLDKSVIKMILERLDIVDKIISETPNDTDGVVNSIYSFFRNHTSKGKKLSEYDQFEQLIETLMENNLHIASAKIKSTL